MPKNNHLLKSDLPASFSWLIDWNIRAKMLLELRCHIRYCFCLLPKNWDCLELKHHFEIGLCNFEQISLNQNTKQEEFYLRLLNLLTNKFSHLFFHFIFDLKIPIKVALPVQILPWLV